MSWMIGGWTGCARCPLLLRFLASRQVIVDQSAGALVPAPARSRAGDRAPGGGQAGAPAGARATPPAPLPPGTPGAVARPSVRPPARRFSRENEARFAGGEGKTSIARPRGEGSGGCG